MKSGFIVAIVFFMLALASAGIGGLGLGYLTAGETTQNQLFYRSGDTRITKGGAAKGMIPVGFGLGAVLIGMGAMRLLKEEDEGEYEEE